MSRRKVAVAMSGGVDSSVAAALLKEEGHGVIGVHMKLWQHRSQTDDGAPSAAGEDDARSVCRVLGVPFHALDFSTQFQRQVVDYFCGEYAQGRTPNPCVVCNRSIKFDLLLRAVEDLGAECLATGHYARLSRDGEGLPVLRRGHDPCKDQSYFLARLGARQLARARFPLGGMTKPAVRALASSQGLAPVAPRESQDICFIRDGSCADFLQQVGGLEAQPGPIVDRTGREIGRHAGIFRYTVGQRRGLGCPDARPYYVVRLDPHANRVVVGRAEDLDRDGCGVSDLSWTGAPPDGPLAVTVRVRYRSPAVAATLHPAGTTAQIRFHQPQRAVAAGQGAVFYQGERVLGSGWIEAES